MKLVLAGTPEVAVPTFELLRLSSHQIVGVLTRPPARTGRGRKTRPSPVAEWAKAHDLPTLELASLRDPQAAQQVAALGADLAVVVAYGVLVPAELLERLPHGWINLHFSALPRWRGAAPAQRAIEAGDTTIATSVFQLEAGLDTGPVYEQETTAIDQDETAGELLERLADSGARQVVRVVDAIDADTAEAAEQPGEGITLAPRITADECHLDPSRPALEVHNFVRARSPKPGAYALLGNDRLKVVRTRVADEEEVRDVVLGGEKEPGTLVATKRHCYLVTGVGAVELLEVAPPGKRQMAAADWARGAHLDEHSTLK